MSIIQIEKKLTIVKRLTCSSATWAISRSCIDTDIVHQSPMHCTNKHRTSNIHNQENNVKSQGYLDSVFVGDQSSTLDISKSLWCHLHTVLVLVINQMVQDFYIMVKVTHTYLKVQLYSEAWKNNWCRVYVWILRSTTAPRLSELAINTYSLPW